MNAGTGILRARAGGYRVQPFGLFLDLVYVFAITQLSHLLLGSPAVPGAARTLIPVLAGVVVADPR